jgi:dihydrofolate synthase / folylpolyglutamate synthase
MKNISVTAIRTKVFKKNESFDKFLETHLTNLSLEGKVLAISSKIVSVAQDRTVEKAITPKTELIKKEADHYLTPGGHGSHLTIKHGILIPSAGIDESNSVDGKYILYPHEPFQVAAKIWRHLRQHFNLKDFGVLLTDSHSMPLRRGVTGISLAHWGFQATNSFVGKKDIFGKPLQFTHVDVVDSLASMAVLAMGEADESCPLALLEAAKVKFSDQPCSLTDISIEPEDDLYYPLLKPFL